MLEVASLVHLAIIQILFYSSEPHGLFSKRIYGKEKKLKNGEGSKILAQKEPFKNIFISKNWIIYKK